MHRSWSFRRPMSLIGPRRLLCFRCHEHKQIPRYGRNDMLTYATNLRLRMLAALSVLAGEKADQIIDFSRA